MQEQMVGWDPCWDFCRTRVLCRSHVAQLQARDEQQGDVREAEEQIKEQERGPRKARRWGVHLAGGAHRVYQEVTVKI